MNRAFASLFPRDRARTLLPQLIAFFVLVSMLVLQGNVGAAATPLKNASYARDLFFDQDKQPGVEANNGISFCLELHRQGEAPRLCNTDTKFRSGDGVKLHLKTNFPGYVYVVMTSGSSGRRAVLFPPASQGSHFGVEGGKEYVIPASGVLRFDNQPGVENLRILMSRAPIADSLSSQSVKNLVLETALTNGGNQALEGLSVSSDRNIAKRDSANGGHLTYVVNEHPSDSVAINFGLRHDGVGSETQTSITGGGAVANSTGSGESSATPRPGRISPPANTGVNRPLTDKWALSIGIGEFMIGGNNLKSPAKDAKDLSASLVQEFNFAPSHVHTLVDAEATRANIVSQLETWLAPRVRADDLVLLYVSSHGTDKQPVGGNFIVTYDFDGKTQMGLLMQDLGNLIKSKIASDRVVVVLDTCFAANAKSKSLDTKDYLDDVLQGAGRIIVSACDMDETSLDTYSRYGNSLFTYHLLQNLRKQPRLKQAFDETRRTVIQDASLMRARQTPVINYDRWQGNDIVFSAKPVNPQP
ncbi:MAG: caspase family protein [Candidatus Obscuribacterales bacterium]|nr:caspase family protein [Candidatus Obscuribacterales bacterium]